jgi:ABC-type multidrug transport system fused ATPase/permease subunit
MNTTNRALNRIVLLFIGIVFLLLGAVAVAVFVWPAAGESWTRAGDASAIWIDQASESTMIGATTLNWLTVAVLALILLLIIILLIVALSRAIGGSRSHMVFRSSGRETPLGRLTIDEGFVSDALGYSLGQRDEILFSNVTANDIRKQPVMHVSVTPRQNTSPRRVAEDVDQLVINLAALTGLDVPTLISIHSGFRAKLAHDQRRIS